MAYDSSLLRLPDPTTNPPGPGFTAVALTNNAQGTVHALNTGATISVRYAGSYWTFSITYPELFPDEARTIIPLLNSLSSGFENIYVQLPQHVYPKNGPIPRSYAGSIALDPSREDSIIVSNWISDFEFEPGDMIKFDNSNKVYMVTWVTNVDAATRNIRLHDLIIEKGKIPAAGFELGELLFRVRMEGGITSQLTNRGLYDGLTVKFRENIL